MFGSAIHKFKKLRLDKQIYAFCLVAKRKVSSTMILSWMEMVKGNQLSEKETLVIKRIYDKLEPKIDWGNEKKNDFLIESLGISVKEMNGIVADILMKWWDTEKREFP